MLFWKKVNRGLLLGAVLVVGMIVFIAVGEARFRREQPAIRDLMREYLGATVELNRVEGALAPDGLLTAEQKTAQTDAFRELLRTYWDASERDVEARYATTSDLSGGFEAFLNAPRNRLRDWRLNIPDSQITIRANGPDRALAEVYVANLTVVSEGAYPKNLFLSCANTEAGTEAEKPGEEASGGLYDVTVRGNFSFDLKRVNGEWKIVGIFSNAYVTNVTEKNGGNAS